MSCHIKSNAGDWCPYVHTGENSGQYRHPHLALAALETWIAHQCMPDMCEAEWLENNPEYASDPLKATSIVWAEMDDNSDPMAQPAVPYVWPNSGDGIYPGHDVLYGDMESKDLPGVYTMESVQYAPVTLPDINSIINLAFPMWEVDGKGKRKKYNECTVDSCEWNPFYVTKRYDGLHPDFGGHPTDNDVRYAFFASSPFDGQPYPGTPHHCPLDAPDDIKAKDCPKIETLSDTDPQGPGHIPPHIALAALTWGVQDGLFPMEDMFDYESYDCRVVPDVLFDMIRNYFPRTEGEKVDYPPPTEEAGGNFPLEFPSGNGLDNQEPPYAPGSPHWCSEEMIESGHWDGMFLLFLSLSLLCKSMIILRTTFRLYCRCVPLHLRRRRCWQVSSSTHCPRCFGSVPCQHGTP